MERQNFYNLLKIPDAKVCFFVDKNWSQWSQLAYNYSKDNNLIYQNHIGFCTVINQSTNTVFNIVTPSAISILARCHFLFVDSDINENIKTEIYLSYSPHEYNPLSKEFKRKE